MKNSKIRTHNSEHPQGRSMRAIPKKREEKIRSRPKRIYEIQK